MLNQLEDDRGILWNPYDEVFERLPRITQEGRPFWCCRVPLINFWIVQIYYPDRVMRQFGCRQVVPPPAPIDWNDELEYMGVKHTQHPELGYNWGTHWEIAVQWASQPLNHMINLIGPHDDHSYVSEYMPWYLREGMPTVFLARYHGSDVTQPRPLPPGPTSSQTYLSQSDAFTRIVSCYSHLFNIL
jgi:hypothetical protein